MTISRLFKGKGNLVGIWRIRGRMLFRAGCHTIEAVQDADPDTLSKATGLPEQTCTRVINSAREWQPVDDGEEDDTNIKKNYFKERHSFF